MEKVCRNYAVTYRQSALSLDCLELKRYFNIEEPLCKNNAEEVWDNVNDYLKKPEYFAQGLIKQSKVEAICTTDNPYDDLKYHKQLKSFGTKVLPTFRSDIGEIKSDITERMDYFNENGCKLSDHSIDRMDEDIIEKVVFLGEEYVKRGWIMQLYIGAMRDN